MLVEGWKQVLWSSWSVRLNVLSAVLSGAEFALPYLNVKPSGGAALTALIISLFSAFARIVSQPKLRARLFPDSGSPATQPPEQQNAA